MVQFLKGENTFMHKFKIYYKFKKNAENHFDNLFIFNPVLFPVYANRKHGKMWWIFCYFYEHVAYNSIQDDNMKYKFSFLPLNLQGLCGYCFHPWCPYGRVGGQVARKSLSRKL